MSTWQITATDSAAYTGGGGVDVIDIDAPLGSSLSIAASAIATVDVGGATLFDLEVRGGPSNDYLFLSMGGLAAVNLSAVTFAEGWDAADRLTILGSGIAAETAVGSAWGEVFAMSKGADSVDGGGGTDAIQVLAPSFGPAAGAGWRTAGNVLTNDSDTTLTFANVEAFWLTLGNAADSIQGLSGDDRIAAGGGTDSLDGGTGHDLLDLGAGQDRAYGGAGRDTLDGGDDNDILYGGADDDAMAGGQGRDLLDGGSGNDSLDDGTGDDQLYGGDGDDTYQVDSGAEWIFEADGAGRDTVVASVSVNLAAIGGSDAGEVERLVLAGTADLHGQGNGYDNEIVGTLGANRLRGRGGADRIDAVADGAADTIWFRAAWESRAAGFDTVSNLDLSDEDRIDVRIGGRIDVDAVARVGGGALRAATLALDTRRALNDHLGAGGGVEAILWNPVGGDLDRAESRFLVVDLDDSGSFEAARDLFVRLDHLTGVIDLSDFITL